MTDTEALSLYPGGFTVRDALALETMREVRVLAGKLGLDRTVRWVHILDIPEIVPWVSRGDLVITNSYAFATVPESTQNLVVRLDEVGVSGLVVGTGLFIDEVPSHMIEEADRRDFPLMEIPWRVRFEDLTLQLTQSILGHQYQVLDRVRMASQELLKACHSEDFDEVAGVLAQALDRAVVLLDGRLDAIAGSEVDLLRDVKRLAADLIEERLTEWTRSSGAPEFHSRLQVTVGDRRVRIQPISTGDRLLGAILFETPQPLGGADSLILSVASTALALEFMRIDEPSRSLFERRREFLDDLAKGAQDVYPSLESRAEFLGWPHDEAFLVTVLDIEVGSAGQDPRTAGALRQRVLETARLYLSPHECMVTQQGGWSLTVLALDPPGQDLPRLIKPLQEALVRLFGGAPITVGVAGPGHHLREVRRLCGEAWEAVRIARKTGRTGRQVSFDEVRAEHVLLGLGDGRETALSLVPELEHVLDYDRRHGRDLFETLEAYLESWGNVGEMARSLYVHRNTARYRIQRIQELLGHSLEDADYRFVLHLATRLIRLSEGQAAP